MLKAIKTTASEHPERMKSFDLAISLRRPTICSSGSAPLA
jgi:hypothetical protein